MKLIDAQIADIQNELQARANWITVACSMLEYAAKCVDDKRLSEEMIAHSKKSNWE